MEKRILVPLAEGFEMIEALSVVDVFRRGEYMSIWQLWVRTYRLFLLIV
jgi:putative intracellular protease/amidase